MIPIVVEVELDPNYFEINVTSKDIILYFYYIIIIPPVEDVIPPFGDVIDVLGHVKVLR